MDPKGGRSKASPLQAAPRTRSGSSGSAWFAEPGYSILTPSLRSTLRSLQGKALQPAGDKSSRCGGAGPRRGPAEACRRECPAKGVGESGRPRLGGEGRRDRGGSQTASSSLQQRKGRGRLRRDTSFRQQLVMLTC